MNAAILSFSTTLEVILAFVLFFAMLWFFAWLDYKHICRPGHVEVEENRDWFWPPKDYKRAGRYVGPSKRERP